MILGNETLRKFSGAKDIEKPVYQAAVRPNVAII